jgi:protoporphyrinogen oxidase
VVFETGERWEADAVVVATDAKTARRFLPESGKGVNWRSVTGIYFSAPRSPLNEAIIALNGNGDGLVNNVCVISDVVPEYAPLGKSLISVSVLGIHEIDGFETRVVAELETWFGVQVREWKHLRTDRIQQALPEQVMTPMRQGIQKMNGVFLCGDYCTSASIEGAIVSGKNTAAAVLASLK